MILIDSALPSCCLEAGTFSGVCIARVIPAGPRPRPQADRCTVGGLEPSHPPLNLEPSHPPAARLLPAQGGNICKLPQAEGGQTRGRRRAGGEVCWSALEAEGARLCPGQCRALLHAVHGFRRGRQPPPPRPAASCLPWPARPGAGRRMPSTSPHAPRVRSGPYPAGPASATEPPLVNLGSAQNGLPLPATAAQPMSACPASSCAGLRGAAHPSPKYRSRRVCWSASTSRAAPTTRRSQPQPPVSRA
jgi:hypothetical protein